MKQNEEEVQYYYDSSADQWWCFDKRQQCWVPWKEEESEDAGHSENTVASARVTGEATANGAAALDETSRQDATGSTSVAGNTRENAADTSEPLVSSGEPGDTEGVGGRRLSAFSPSRAADSVASHAKNGEAQNSTTPGNSAARGLVATVESSEKLTDHGGTSRAIKRSAEARTVATSTAACRSEATAAADVDKTSTRRAAAATERRATSGVALTAADDKHQQQLLRDNAEENETEANEKGEEDTSVHEVDRLRSALESLATSPCLDQALIRIRTSGSLNRTLPSTDGGGSVTGRIDETKYKASAGRVDRLSSAGSGNVSGLRGMSLSQKTDEEHTVEENEDEDDQDVVGELPDIVKPDPIVRRSTRMLTFKDKGGLAGCLREAAKQRNDMIKEAGQSSNFVKKADIGGYIPGTEEYREEAWKQRARRLASQTHVRTQNKWKEAARKVFDASGGKNSEDKVMHFADLVDRIRRKSEGDEGQARRADSDLSRFATYSLGSMSAVPPKSTTHVDPEIVAANLLLKPDVDLREQRRRSSGFTGGQQGHVRFADAAFRDPNSQLQMQDLLTQQSRRKVMSRKEDTSSFVEAFRQQESGEQGEPIE